MGNLVLFTLAIFGFEIAVGAVKKPAMAQFFGRLIPVRLSAVVLEGRPASAVTGVARVKTGAFPAETI